MIGIATPTHEQWGLGFNPDYKRVVFSLWDPWL
jgi:hypothetical protein